jgi:hypothetical protein
VLICLLKASLPLSRQHLQKLFSNLAAHSTTRQQLLKVLFTLLVSLPGSVPSSSSTGSGGDISDAEEAAAGKAGMDISEDGSQGNSQQQQQHQEGLASALDRLKPTTPTAHSNTVSGVSAAASSSPEDALASSPQGKPAIVSRRVLDMLTYLSCRDRQVARQVLSLQVNSTAGAGHPVDDKAKGKMPASAVVAAEASAPRALEVLLAMLGAPLCQRSVSLMELLMALIQVVLKQVQRYEAERREMADMQQQAQRKQAEEEQRQKQEDEQQQQQQAPASEPGTVGAASDTAITQQPEQQQQQQQEAALPAGDAQRKSSNGKQQQDKQQQPQPAPSELATMLSSVLPSLLKQLPALLARELLPEPVYADTANVIKLIVEAAPVHLPLMLSELVDGAAGVADALLGYLDAAAAKGIDADAQLAPAIGTKSSVVLRMLCALQGFQTEVQQKLKQQEEQKKKQEEEEEDRRRQEAAKTATATTAAATTAAAAATGSSSGTSQVAAETAAGSSRTAAAAAAEGTSTSGAAGQSSSGAAAGASSSSMAAATTSIDPVEASAEIDAAIATIASRTAALWKSLSSCILRIEDNLRAVLPQQMQGGGESAGSAAARLLPPGAQQVLPLVEAFFVLCALQGTIPAAPTQGKDLLTAPSLDINLLTPGAGQAAPAATATAAAASRGTPPPGPALSAGQLRRAASVALEAGGSLSQYGDGALSMPFLRFADHHRRLLNAYIRRNTGLLESSLAPLLRVPRLIDFDNKRAYFRWGHQGAHGRVHTYITQCDC